jgi:hypothetical protein
MRHPKPKPGAEPTSMVFDGIVRGAVIRKTPGGILIGLCWREPASMAACSERASSTVPSPTALKSRRASYHPAGGSLAEAGAARFVLASMTVGAYVSGPALRARRLSSFLRVESCASRRPLCFFDIFVRRWVVVMYQDVSAVAKVKFPQPWRTDAHAVAMSVTGMSSCSVPASTNNRIRLGSRPSSRMKR